MSVQNINIQSIEALKAQSKPLLVEFYKDSCGPCRALSPVIDEIASERDDLIVGKVNVESEPALAASFAVRSVPTVIVLQNGNIISRAVGLHRKDEILALLEKLKA